MIKTLLLSAITACLSLQAAQAQHNAPTNIIHNTKPSVAAADFLNTTVSRNYSASQMATALRQGAGASLAVPHKATSNVVVLSEDFNKLTKGTPDQPDTEEMDDDVAAQLLPDWTAWHVYQAGGTAYLGYKDTESGDPGYLMTPSLDLTGGQGVYKVTFRAKNVNPNSTSQGLQYFVFDNATSSAMLANSLPISNTEFSEVSFTGSKGSAQTAIMFFGWQGHVLIDSVVVEQVIYSINTPQNVTISAKDGSSLHIAWDAVDEATSYDVKVYNYTGEYDLDDENAVAAVNVATNEADVACDFNATYGVYVTVVAKNTEAESYPGTAYTHELEVGDIETPVALDATNVSEQGFTANWQSTPNAHNYKLNVTRTHEATEDGEKAVLMDDDFDEITTSLESSESTLMNMETFLVSFDDYINSPGWYTLAIGVAAQDIIGITNMYEAYGFPGLLAGPVADYSIGGGKFTVSGSAFSYSDDVVMTVGFGTFTLGEGVSFLDGAQEITIKPSPTEMKGTDFSVEVSGGQKDSQLIFLITDAAEDGDMALFDRLNIETSLNKGDQFTSHYASATLPYDATSYVVEAPLKGNDYYEYNVTGTFGATTSDVSNTIVVRASTATGINLPTSSATDARISVYTTDGRQVVGSAGSSAIKTLSSGLYIVRQGNKTFKVAK